MEHLFLTRRNLEVLLSKLNRQKAGEQTACTIVKYDNPHGIYTQSMPEIMIRAVEDDEYYIARKPGVMHEKDIPASEIPTTNDIP